MVSVYNEVVKNHKKIITVIAITAVLIALYNFFNINTYLSLASIQEYREILLEKINTNYIFWVVTFISVYTLLTALSIPAATLITLLGGSLFGFLEGGVYVIVGATLGASIIFMLARYLLAEYFRKLLGEKKISRIDREVDENGASYLLFLRLVPVFPFWVVNIVPAFVNISFVTFLWTTFVGIIPGTLAFTYAGEQLATLQKISDILTPGFISALVVLGVISLVPAYIKKFK